MNVRQRVDVGRVGLYVAAVTMGLGIGTLTSPGSTAVPVAGTVPDPLVGGVALVAGGALYLAVRRSGEGCDCGGACDC